MAGGQDRDVSAWELPLNTFICHTLPSTMTAVPSIQPFLVQSPLNQSISCKDKEELGPWLCGLEWESGSSRKFFPILPLYSTLTHTGLLQMWYLWFLSLPRILQSVLTQFPPCVSCSVTCFLQLHVFWPPWLVDNPVNCYLLFSSLPLYLCLCKYIYYNFSGVLKASNCKYICQKLYSKNNKISLWRFFSVLLAISALPLFFFWQFHISTVRYGLIFFS
jgi:hypothetical protein